MPRALTPLARIAKAISKGLDEPIPKEFGLSFTDPGFRYRSGLGQSLKFDEKMPKHML
ncbi:MAG TPA: hypothetical protein VIY49_16070 [Bryobacteraceae bacterium]